MKRSATSEFGLWSGFRAAWGFWFSHLALLPALGLFLLPTGLSAAVQSKKLPAVPKWARFEQSFKSRVAYSNALQEARLTVVFSSPLGETNQVDGFWDGGKTWRVRFSPDQPGRWNFRTVCSDAANLGLHNRTGEFLCTSATGQGRFNRHGPVRVARDHRHFEHADGTPFFWLADTVWNGARVSDPKDWSFYAATRAFQDFTVAQWAVAPGADASRRSAFSGTDRIAINPEFFQRLDAKLSTLNRAGLLSAIVPVAELSAQGGASTLPEDQALLFVRYVVARWGAEPVAWLLAFEGDGQPKDPSRWKRIGRAAFGEGSHAPVILFAGKTPLLLDEFRDQQWVDAFGCQCVTDLSDDTLKLTFAGPFAAEWRKEPARPLIPFAPYENAISAQSQKRFSSADVRHAVYWSLLLTPPAGVSYGAQGVANWDLAVGPNDPQKKLADLPLWHKALFMPAAKQMSYLAKVMDGIDFWTLRPQPKVLATQPGEGSARRFIAAEATEPNGLALIYVPEDRTIDVFLNALPTSPAVSWFNPRSGENSSAVAVVSTSTCQFPTPDPGDWLLVIKAGK